MLVNLKELLTVAKEHNFAIGAFNSTDLSLVRSVIEEAERLNSPVIIQAAVGEFNFATEDFYQYVVKRLEKSSVPCVLHLDHGKTLEDCVRAIRAGFTSVMIDGSELSFEENMELTKKVVEIAHAANVSVEGELGTIGSMSGSDEGGVENITYTDPEDVKNFVNETNVDALAVAIGTAHGLYPKGYDQKLQLGLLKDICKVSDIPLVLHGGSDNLEEDIKEACRIGIQKINISSDIKKAFFEEVKVAMEETGSFMPPAVFSRAILKTKEVVASKMTLFGSVNKANLYK